MKHLSAKRPGDDRPVAQNNLEHIAGCRGAAFRHQVRWRVNVGIIACGVRFLWKREASKGFRLNRKNPARPDGQDIFFA